MFWIPSSEKVAWKDLLPAGLLKLDTESEEQSIHPPQNHCKGKAVQGTTHWILHVICFSREEYQSTRYV